MSDVDNIQVQQGIVPSYRSMDNMPKHGKLYNLAKFYKQRRVDTKVLNSNNDYNFHPKVNKSHISASFSERQLFYNHKRQEFLQK